MLTRIVKLTFEEEKIADFLKIFEEHRIRISDFEGFSSLELFQDSKNHRVFFTHSLWTDKSALENYRGSAYFRTIWNKTKLLFADKPQAWSLTKI